MNFRVQLNPQRGGRYLGGQESTVIDSTEAAIEPLGAQPGDAQWVEPLECDVRWVFLVERDTGGLCAVPA